VEVQELEPEINAASDRSRRKQPPSEPSAGTLRRPSKLDAKPDADRAWLGPRHCRSNLGHYPLRQDRGSAAPEPLDKDAALGGTTFTEVSMHILPQVETRYFPRQAMAAGKILEKPSRIWVAAVRLRSAGTEQTSRRLASATQVEQTLPTRVSSRARPAATRTDPPREGPLRQSRTYAATGEDNSAAPGRTWSRELIPGGSPPRRHPPASQQPTTARGEAWASS
jgi:hypothetical protein